VAKKKIKVVNKSMHEWHAAEETRMAEQHTKEKSEHGNKKPKGIDMTLLAEDAEPLVLPNEVVVMPGSYYGVNELGDEFVLAPADIGKFWVEV